jgi:hypothetical protein
MEGMSLQLRVAEFAHGGRFLTSDSTLDPYESVPRTEPVVELVRVKRESAR